MMEFRNERRLKIEQICVSELNHGVQKCIGVQKQEFHRVQKALFISEVAYGVQNHTFHF